MVVQRSSRLTNVGAGAFGTWDAVHYSLPAVFWYWILGPLLLLSMCSLQTIEAKVIDTHSHTQKTVI